MVQRKLKFVGLWSVFEFLRNLKFLSFPINYKSKLTLVPNICAEGSECYWAPLSKNQNAFFLDRHTLISVVESLYDLCGRTQSGYVRFTACLFSNNLYCCLIEVVQSSWVRNLEYITYAELCIFPASSQSNPCNWHTFW